MPITPFLLERFFARHEFTAAWAASWTWSPGPRTASGTSGWDIPSLQAIPFSEEPLPACTNG